ncbi:Necrosis inducing protein [Phytophthora cactorum]|nr:Necrosis inducing protein [Phytophthora cactorum]
MQNGKIAFVISSGMTLYAVFWVGLAVLRRCKPKTDLKRQPHKWAPSAVSSQNQDPVETPEPGKNYIDFSDLTHAPSSSSAPNVTIGPTRPDPRQTEAPTPVPTLPPTLPHSSPTPAPTPDPGRVKFKPQIQIRTGCEPYPAVNEFGETGGGLKPTGKSRGKCGGSGYGSQVYGRSTWFKGVWAIVYSWYFPKDSPSSGMGHRHDWEHAIVFIDNPDVRYKHAWPKNHDLATTGDAGKFQDLIMWDQLTDDARRALNSVSFGSANTPFKDGIFQKKLENAWPSSKCTGSKVRPSLREGRSFQLADLESLHGRINAAVSMQIPMTIQQLDFVAKQHQVFT